MSPLFDLMLHHQPQLYHIKLFKSEIQQISSLPVGYKKYEHLRSIDKGLSTER